MTLNLDEIEQRARRLKDGFAKVNGRDLAVAVAQDALALAARVRAYEKALEKLRRSHLLVDEDCWYSCPSAQYEDGSSGYCGPDTGCNCGADEYNAIIDAALHPEPTP